MFKAFVVVERKCQRSWTSFVLCLTTVIINDNLFTIFKNIRWCAPVTAGRSITDLVNSQDNDDSRKSGIYNEYHLIARCKFYKLK